MYINGSRIEGSRRENLSCSSPHSFPFWSMISSSDSILPWLRIWLDVPLSIHVSRFIVPQSYCWLFIFSCPRPWNNFLQLLFSGCCNIPFWFPSPCLQLCCLWLKSLGFESDSCMTDTAYNSNKIHYVTHLIVKTPLLDIGIKWKT